MERKLLYILKERENKENEVGFRFGKQEHFLHPTQTPNFAKNRKLIPHEYINRLPRGKKAILPKEIFAIGWALPTSNFNIGEGNLKEINLYAQWL